jgi:hypothetical protein
MHTKTFSLLFAGTTSLLLVACADDAALPTGPAARTRPSAALLDDVTAGAATSGPLVSALGANVCADVWGASTAAGAPLKVYQCHGGANQQFALQASGEITAYDGRMCLDVWAARANDGDPVVVYTCHGGANQKWTLTAAGEIRTAVNGKCLDVWGNSGANGTKLAVYTCHGAANQKWSFAAAAPMPAAPVVGDAPVGGSAELPRVYLDTRMPAATGRTINVAAGGDLQAALDAAQPGDEVVLAPGATFIGNFMLPRKAGMTAGQWITVRTGGALPAEGTRVSPADAGQMPKVLTYNVAPAIQTAPGAQGWRLTGIEFGLGPGVPWAYTVVAFGTSGTEQNTMAQVPSRIVLDRSYVHASPSTDIRRCVMLNGASSAVVDSYLSECHSRNSESQGILGWNGPGPFKITNNHIEGGHEVIAFGGADPTVPGVVPGDMEIRQNHIVRPLAWRGVWGAKNLLELKAGQRLLIEGNVFENNWPDAQNGFAFVWWSINADGGAPWTVTQDITFRYNRVRGVAQGFNLGVGNNPSMPARRITIAHNVVTGPDSTGMRMFQVDGGLVGLTIANNTAIGGEHSLVFASPSIQLPSLLFRNNVTGGQYTFYAAGIGFGAAAIPGMGIASGNVAGNVFVTSEARMVPAGNEWTTSHGGVGFLSYQGGDVRLGNSSPYLTAGVGGTTPGADVARVNQLTAGVVR